VLGKVPGSRDQYGDVSRHPENEQLPDVVVIRVESGLFFANADWVRDHILAQVSDETKAIVLDAENIPTIDVTALRMLTDLADDLDRRGFASCWLTTSDRSAISSATPRARRRSGASTRPCRTPSTLCDTHAMPAAEPVASTEGMVRIPAGQFLMGSEDFYPEERPVRRVEVEGFWMDERAVTAGEFRRFVRETGYVTVAERPLDPADYPDADPELLVPGSLVFRMTSGPVPLNDVRSWWEYVPGAFWKKPGGPGTTINGRDHHPVVQVAYEDAEAYAAWAGKELPTEAEWEYAARGGLEGAAFAWGDEHFPDGRPMANSWQGEFPWQNLKLDGFEGTSPVGSFPPNGYGLRDMTGNTWEWTSDWFRADGSAEESPAARRRRFRASAFHAR
jgi:sulfatase modifying factor 1